MNCLSLHIINTIPQESALYSIYALVVFISAISLFRSAHSVEPPVSGHPQDQGVAYGEVSAYGRVKKNALEGI